MTEADWLACDDPQVMLNFLCGKVSERKLRLFACFCCRMMKFDRNSVNARGIEEAEKYADGLISRKEQKKARRRVWENRIRSDETLVVWHALDFMARHAAARAASEAACSIGSSKDEAGMKRQCAAIREICGNAFRSVSVSSFWLAWNDGTVPKMAQAVYDERAFDRLPLLADALEEAGCDNPDVLAHCRSGGEHVRGCWVVDLLLGKS